MPKSKVTTKTLDDAVAIVERALMDAADTMDKARDMLKANKPKTATRLLDKGIEALALFLEDSNAEMEDEDEGDEFEFEIDEADLEGELD